jgi:enoyl-CoA hydratase
MAETAYETILLEREPPLAWITVNRPDKRNALNATVRREIVAALVALHGDRDMRVIVLTGAGEKAFIAGADIGEFAERTPIEQRAAMTGPRLFEAVADFPRPTIAMINGLALGGGCEVALACDLRIAARSAKLGQPEVRLGLIPGGGATQRLPRLTGFGNAMRLVLTGELVDAEDAHRMGLVDRVVDDAALRSSTRELALHIASHSTVAVELAKTALRASMEMPLAAGLALERELFLTAFASEDGKEGVRAFVEKRPPQFRGR